MSAAINTRTDRDQGTGYPYKPGFSILYNVVSYGEGLGYVVVVLLFRLLFAVLFVCEIIKKREAEPVL